MDTYGADYAALAGVSAVFWIIGHIQKPSKKIYQTL